MTPKKKTKTVGLAEYLDRPTATTQEPSNGSSSTKSGADADKPVPVQIFMSKANRQMLKRFALDQHTSLQNIGIHAFNLALAEKGLKPLKEQK